MHLLGLWPFPYIPECGLAPREYITYFLLQGCMRSEQSSLYKQLWIVAFSPSSLNSLPLSLPDIPAGTFSTRLISDRARYL